MYRGCLPIDKVKNASGSSSQMSSRHDSVVRVVFSRSQVAAGATQHTATGVQGRRPPARMGR